MLLGCVIVDRVPIIAQSSVIESVAEPASHFAEISLSTDNYLVGSILLKSQVSFKIGINIVQEGLNMSYAAASNDKKTQERACPFTA